MAKRVPPSEPPAEEELVVTVVRFKGSGETARKGIDAVSQAIAAAFGGNATIVRQVNGRKQAQLATGSTEDAIDAEAVDTQDDTESEEAAAPAPRKKSEPGKPKYSFLPEFNTAPDGVPSLRDFCADKDGGTETNRYLLISYWLMKHGGADPFTGNHVFTCFRDLQPWKGRLDIMQPVREMASKRSFYTSSERGQWRLTAVGLKAAEAIGPKA